MRPVYLLGLFSFLLLKSMNGQTSIDLSINLGPESELTSVPRSLINGTGANCLITNNGEDLVSNVYVEFNYYKLPNIQNPEFTLYSNPTEVPADTTVAIFSASPIFIGTTGQYQFSYVIKTDKEDIDISDNVAIQNILIDNEIAMDDGVSVATIGIGNGIHGEIGQVFTINQAQSLDQVDIYLENITAVMTGEPVSINVYEFDDGPQDLFVQSDTVLIAGANNSWISIPFPEATHLEAGKYIFAVVENDKNLNLGMSETIFTPGSTWFRHDNLDWTDAQAFNFNKPFMIRPILSSTCPVNTQDLEVESCEFYTSDSGQNTWFESGIYEEILPSYNYCDSVIIYDVTITQVDLGIQISDNVLIVQEEEADNYQWFDCNSGTLIPGETNQIFTASSNGSYQVLINKGECSFFSECHTILSVGTVESTFNKQIEIYPNPNDGLVNINMKEPLERIKIRLLDIEGKSYMEQEYQNTQFISFQINIPPGTYIVQIEDGDGRQASLKIIKQ